jgi:hypothetical protein
LLLKDVLVVLYSGILTQELVVTKDVELGWLDAPDNLVVPGVHNELNSYLTLFLVDRVYELGLVDVSKWLAVQPKAQRIYQRGLASARLPLNKSSGALVK